MDILVPFVILPAVCHLCGAVPFGWIVGHSIPRRPLKKSFTTKSRGTRLLVLEGGVGVPNDSPFFASRLTARASGEPLPVAGRASGCSFGSGHLSMGSCWSTRLRFSKWNEPVHVQAPATSVPIGTVRAS